MDKRLTQSKMFRKTHPTRELLKTNKFKLIANKHHLTSKILIPAANFNA
jgi:hypothetical protein